MNPLDRYRDLFPVTRELVYMNHAAIAPINTRVSDAVRAYLDELARFGGIHRPGIEDRVEACRSKFAALIGADSSEIAFVKNTSEGISIIANGVNWQEGDQVLIPDMEYPANVYPWFNLKDRGVETVLIKNREGRYPVEAFAEVITRRTRLISVSSVQFATGFRADLKEMGNLCQENDILFCIDAIQSLGAFPLNVKDCGADFLAADSQKWLLGIEGIGCLYVSHDRLPHVRPDRIGWASVKDPMNFLHYDPTLQETAEKFEEGSLNTMSIWGLGAALDLLAEIGLETVQKRILDITRLIIEGVERLGYRVTSSPVPAERSGIVTFAGAVDSRRVVTELLARKIVSVERAGAIRVSPHFYNNEDDVVRLIAALAEIR